MVNQKRVRRVMKERGNQKRLEKIARLERVLRSRYDGPGEHFRFKGKRGELGFISRMPNHFCNSCNRVRLTAE